MKNFKVCCEFPLHESLMRAFPTLWDSTYLLFVYFAQNSISLLANFIYFTPNTD
ncbi:hypothetical protein CAL7102_09378 [Dulcicalothrix desertica PCC 7102]|nr:hypothetical protein CAL7102_09378 [Dulcicalothrix desertica PCC 7102]